MTVVRLDPPRRRRPGADVTVADDMPATGPLVDRFGRVHDDLRLSFTDRCNLRCTYCMPETGMVFSPPGDLLTADELERIGRVARSLGVRTVRLTGGEPLVRRGVVELVRRLAAIGFDDLALTTNGMHLGRLAAPLAAAGLRRVNVSCDSLRPERFAAIRRRGDLPTVLAAMDAAEAAGLGPVKVNVVLIAGVNDDEVVDFAELARRTGRPVRFIEFMPLDGDRAWRPDAVVPGDRVLEQIGALYPLEPVPDVSDSHAPAERFAFTDGRGEIGVVRSVTRPFCADCNRLRVTADGAVRNCLFTDDERSLLPVLRGEGDDGELAAVFRRAVWGKRAGHGMDDPGFVSPTRSMSMIGG
jgi:cyclic pyranopterin phosphate synthase